MNEIKIINESQLREINGGAISAVVTAKVIGKIVAAGVGIFIGWYAGYNDTIKGH